MSVRRPLSLICFIAALHGLLLIWYQQPDWATQWPDQDGYKRLGQVLAATGKFTRFPDAPRFVPEVLRTPAYPIFVAAVYRVFGVSQIAVALAQTALFVGICVLVFLLGRLVFGGNGDSADRGDRLALAAAAVTALYPPIPYFGALVMTEVWTTALFTAAMLLAVRAWRKSGLPRFAALGLVLGATALSRPVFVLFPFALAATGLIAIPVLEAVGARRRRTPPRARHWAVMLVAFAITMLPWFTYNYLTVGAFTISPAGGVGRGMWEGSWQAMWSGRLQNELTHLADDIDDRTTLDARVSEVALREHLPAGPMLAYVHQWEDIRRIWTEPVDSAERARARVLADREYLRVSLTNIRGDGLPHLVKRLARGVFVLWAGEIPIRYSEINRLPPALIYGCWALQAVLMLASLYGLVVLARAGRLAEACLLAAPIVYVTAVHFPLLTEARQSLPAMPTVLLLATIGAAHAFSRHSLALEPQVHEREHL